ncbi:hypothetical protein O6H91_07G021700 [Diphasiastrum complanatum]|uniref:Uncharacterized protein n=5 Tax=Diphasiastrum complanatum TaxID=34168 RepID=A0ACC2D303_DIPCM|nr:hypothetical protein O6H91_07G021700 [Diphasiastrum complanatum]KAJ7548671.1 hypothetical protein O6H91_07G021700 [Diphasiastrum complanatum]KAJ7548674.1 hypothetical protein O6H91_07G021700 [Diphasiastrum complanatum]KAJ7548675.1 hypothetical protein O6H91_07G021700 [Diphasiastrum complanatum]
MSSFLNDHLSKKTAIFGLKLWVVLGIGVGVIFAFILFFLSIWLASRRRSRRSKENFPHTIPIVSKEIQEVKMDRVGSPYMPPGFSMSGSDISGENDSEKAVVRKNVVYSDAQSRYMPNDTYGSQARTAFIPETVGGGEMQNFSASDSEEVQGYMLVTGCSKTPGRFAPRTAMDKQEVGYPGLTKHELVDSPSNQDRLQKAAINLLERGLKKDSLEKTSHGSGDSRSTESSIATVPEVCQLGWGHWYSLRDLSVATEEFADCNVVGEGGYGIVYRGQIDDTMIAIKNLLNNRGQAEKEFRVEVEAIGKVRHKNLVRLLGFCADGNYRMLVYEYVDNGNLEQWLHGPMSKTTTLTWEARMKVILGTAKALTYLHEALEPKVVHRDIKASNILIDSQYNAKVSDFGLAKLLGSDKSHVTTRVMGTFGYVAPEYANTGLLNERSDVYSFGVLLMEVITGRDPVDYSRPPGEVNLVDWVKIMVGSRRSEDVADPHLEVKPSSRALKRALLIALRCVDPDSLKRPKMGHVVHMLEADDFPFHDERRVSKNIGRAKQKVSNSQEKMLQSLSKEVDLEDGTSIENLSPKNKTYKKPWRRYEG